MKRAVATPGRIWNGFERVTFWALAAATLVAVGFVDRTPLVSTPLVGYLGVFVLWLARAAVFGRAQKGWKAVGRVAGVGVLVGLFGVVTGLWLDPLWSPTFSVAPVETSSIIDMSRFRSCVGHDYSGPAVGSAGQDETDRSMKHYVSIDVRYGDDVTVVVRAMADGVITATDEAGDITLTMSGFSGFGTWELRYMHVVPTVAEGTRVRAGDEIGVLPPADWSAARDADGSPTILPTHPIQFDLALGYQPLIPFGQQLDSVLHHLDTGLEFALTDAGFTADELVVAKRERDAQPCGGQYDTEPEADWAYGDMVRRAADEAASAASGEQGGQQPTTTDEFALRPTCTEAVIATKWMQDDGTLWTCLLDDAGAPTWKQD